MLPRAMVLHQLLTLALVLGAESQRKLCFASERCKLERTAPTGQVTRIDLSPLCREGGGYFFNGSSASGQTFFFNICGNSSQPCSDYQNALTGPEYESWGIATQLLQNARGVNPYGCLAADNATECTDFTFGGKTCCSPRRCEVVAGPFFQLELLNSSNPASGGVVMTTAGWPDSPTNDNTHCPEQASGLPRLRQFVLTLQCNPSGAPGELEILSYNENSPYCVFRVTARSLAACGMAVPSASPTPSASPQPSASASLSASPSLPPPPPPASAGTSPTPSPAAIAGSNFGFVVLGGALALGVQALVAYGRAALGSGGSGSERLGLLSRRAAAASASAAAAGGGHVLFPAPQGKGGASFRAL